MLLESEVLSLAMAVHVVVRLWVLPANITVIIRCSSWVRESEFYTQRSVRASLKVRNRIIAGPPPGETTT